MSTLDDAIKAAGPPPAGSGLSVLDQAISGSLSSGDSSTGYMFHPDPNVSSQSDQPAEAGSTPLSMVTGAASDWAGNKLVKGAQAIGVTDPNSLRDIRNIPAAVGTIAPFALGRLTAEEPRAPIQPHPLAEAAKAEQSSLDAMDEQASAAGFDLPSKTLSKPNKIVNNLGRQDLQLPTAAAHGIDAPLTPDMLHVGNKQYVSPPFQAVEQYPKPIPLSAATKATFADVRPLLSPAEAKALPEGDEITAAQGIKLSQTLRARANQIPDSGINTTTNQMWSDIGKAHMDAARSIEGDIKTQLASDGQGKLADDWRNAVVYRAKSAAYEHSLDGAGNIRATDLRTQLVKQGVPLTDNAKLIATVAAKHPEMFKGTPAVPQPSFIKRATAGTLPAAGAAIGAGLAGAPGAVAGEFLGKHFGDKLLRP